MDDFVRKALPYAVFWILPMRLSHGDGTVGVSVNTFILCTHT